MRQVIFMRDRIQAALFCASVVVPSACNREVREDKLAVPPPVASADSDSTATATAPPPKPFEIVGLGTYPSPAVDTETEKYFCEPRAKLKKFVDYKNLYSSTTRCPYVLKTGEGSYIPNSSDERGRQDRIAYLTSETDQLRALDPKYRDGCCYVWRRYRIYHNKGGRPFLDGTQAVTAPVRSGHGWLRNRPAVGVGLAAATRARLAQVWLEDARAEHASIASFARATLELLAVGAPAALVRDCQRAGLDEVRHAERCFELASAYGDCAFEPGPLAALAPREADLDRLGMDTFVEGCVGETISALQALRASSRGPAAVTKVWKMLAADELRHAELAWRTLLWVAKIRGAALVHSLIDLVTSQRGARFAAESEAADTDLEGRLSQAEQALVHQQAWGEIILPTLHSIRQVVSAPLERGGRAAQSIQVRP